MNKKILIVTNDIKKQGETDISYAAATLLGTIIKNCPGWKANYHPIILANNENDVHQIYDNLVTKHQLNSYDLIAIGSYIWSEHLINPLIALIKRNGFPGKIILGGYQITYSRDMEIKYPDADIFICGNAEMSIVNLLNTSNGKYRRYYSDKTDLALIPPLYSDRIIRIRSQQPMVRLETKRGCPYRCSYCRHKDIIHNELKYHNVEKVTKELTFLHSKEVRKINFIDPVFNIGSYYNDILNHCINLGIKSHMAFQSRFELINTKAGKTFIDAISQLNCTLEFGLQTIHQAELELINRKNDLPVVKNVITMLNELEINYEVSIIYGLPGQTTDSFKYTIDFLKNNNVATIKAYPLKLLRGTMLYKEKFTLGLKEKIVPEIDLHIPMVVSSFSYNTNDWYRMMDIASSLSD